MPNDSASIQDPTNLRGNRGVSGFGMPQRIGLSQPLLGNFGTVGRNTRRAIGQANFDWNVYKNTAITERVSVQLRGEIYNVFNHHSFQDVNRNISNPAFGQYTTPAQSQRYLQLAAVLRF